MSMANQLNFDVDIYDTDKDGQSSSLISNTMKPLNKRQEILSPKSSNLSNMKFNQDMLTEWTNHLIQFQLKDIEIDYN